MRVVNIVLALALSSLAIGHALADPASPGKKCPADNQATSAARMQLLPGLSRLDLTADEKAKIAELKKEYGPKLQEIRLAKEAVLTAEQKQARQDVLDAAKAARAAGKKPGNVRKAVAAAMNVTADQKTKIAKLDKAAAVLRAEVRVKALAILTPEQVAELKQLKQHRRHHKANPGNGSQPAPDGQSAPAEKTPADQAPAGQ